MAATAMTDSAPLISVCIANYNGMALIDECLRSVLEQTGNIAVEILLHDDASSDGSAAYIRDRYPIARLIVSENNVGFCVANNRMAAEAKGKYLLLLNNDAALYPDALQTLLAEADRLDRPAILSLPQYDAASGQLIDRGCLLDPFFNPVPNLDPTRKDVAMVIGACLWIPKALWEELEGFPEWFGSIAEDMYLCCRARLAGYAVRVLTGSGYRHWQGRSFGGNRVVERRLSTTFMRRALSERNKTFVMAITCPTPVMLWLFPLHLLLVCMEGITLSILRGQMTYFFTIYWPVIAAIVTKKQWLTFRKRTQKARNISLMTFFAPFLLIHYKLNLFRKFGLPEVN
jgi:GT2 family glycosyltransferase